MEVTEELENARSMSRDEDTGGEESSSGIIFQASIRTPQFGSQKLNLGEFCRTFSTTTWCPRTSLIACATETCARDPRSNLHPGFWIPVNILSPERPTENATFNVPADSPFDSMQFLDWSPPNCPLALLAVNSGGRITIWSHPQEDYPGAAQAINHWSCEHVWRQDYAAVTKWISATPPYRWSTSTAKPSFEERFISQQPRFAANWPNFLCVCTVFTSGCVQIRWRQQLTTDRLSAASSKWHVTNKGALGAGPSGICAADAIVNEAGVLLVAGVPIGNPSTVVVWEVNPWTVNGSANTQQASVKFVTGVQPPLSLGSSWNGYAPLAASLLNWQQQGDAESKADTKVGPLLQCAPVSNLAAYVKVEGSTPSGMPSTGWGSGLSAVAFDPSAGGSALLTIVCEGYYLSPHPPVEGPTLTGWKVQRWESSSQQVGIHPLFDSSGVNYTSLSYPMRTSWRAVETKNLPTTHQVRPPPKTQKVLQEDRLSGTPMSHIHFSRHGVEAAVCLTFGDIHIFSVSNLVLLDTFLVGTYNSPAMLAFSPNGCCMAYAWHSRNTTSTVLKVLRVQPAFPQPGQGLTNSIAWERHLADRFWWSLVNKFDWWDVAACVQNVAEEGTFSVSRVVAVLDSDFHMLPTAAHRQYYGSALDCIKCQILEGMDATDIRALVLDMQARLLMEFLRKSLDAALINPSTLIAEPWQGSQEVLAGFGPDAMAVDAALVPSIQAHVDSILDMASHFLTRLRRYASFCRTLSQAAGNSASVGANSRFANLSTMASNTAAQGSQAAPASGGATQLHPWVVQGAMAKINNTAEGAAATATSVGGQNGAFSSTAVNTSTFPGIPAVRLVGDTYFLHRLCQLLLFCLVFRKRQQRYTGAAQKSLQDGKTVPGGQAPEDYVATRNPRFGNGNVGQGYTTDEVKYLFLVLVDLCKKTSSLAHPLPVSQVSAANQIVRLHYVDGQYNVVPEIVETSLAPHMQNLPRPRGADAAGLLMRELELHPPSEEWNHLVLSGGSVELAFDRAEIDPKSRYLWPRKRRHIERNAACGLITGAAWGSYVGLLGSRRDAVTVSWRTAVHGYWHKCVRCGRHTAALAGSAANPNALGEGTSQETWWTGRWAHGCPICEGQWLKIV